MSRTLLHVSKEFRQLLGCVRLTEKLRIAVQEAENGCQELILVPVQIDQDPLELIIIVVCLIIVELFDDCVRLPGGHRSGREFTGMDEATAGKVHKCSRCGRLYPTY